MARNKNISVAASRKVLVGMSGGVDSSVAAALLKRAGFQVAGVYLRCWDEYHGCRASDDEYMARLAAAHIAIPFYVFDFTKEYKEKVLSYFLSEYQIGRTPNPDVMCNREIKFGLLFDKAMQLGFDYMATGHYARTVPVGEGVNVLCGRDGNKDQSYFLCQVPREKFRKVLFPIGSYLKSEVRAMAREFGLPNADRKDSQGICFVGKVKVTDFLQSRFTAEKGDIKDIQGNVLGRHEGLPFYTIGQRKGIELSGGPFYVVSKEKEENVLVVSRDENDLCQKELVAKDINWITKAPPDLPFSAQVRIRYRQDVVPATIKEHSKGAMHVVFEQPQRAVTSGQSVVFYNGEELLGGGIIQ